MSFTCPDCLRTSHNPHDEIHKYCGRCHEYKGMNLQLTPFQTTIAKAIQGEFPAEYALKAAMVFQLTSGEDWRALMLQSLPLLGAKRLNDKQMAALGQVCDLTVGKSRGH